MTAKKWIKTWSLSIVILLLIGVINYIVDPYQQYRKSTFYKIPYENSRELNAGLAKNFDYDSIIIGTSMTQNFSINDFKKILQWQKPIKLSMAGSSAYEQGLTMQTALRHKNIKNILLGIDFFSYYGAPNRYKHGEAFFPEYLYDEKLLNDYKYLMSSDTLKRSFKVLFSKKDAILYDFSKMYEWHSKTKQKEILKVLHQKWKDRKFFDNEAKESEKKFSLMKKNFDINIKPLIQNHPNTQFVLFFPPYSILAYKVYEERKQLEEFMRFKLYLVQTLSNFSNVTLYDFQYADKIIFNLQNYYDLYHYNRSINRWMLQQIKQRKYLINSIKKEQEDSKNFIKKVRQFQINKELFYK